jgi:hypothetical protein
LLGKEFCVPLSLGIGLLGLRRRRSQRGFQADRACADKGLASRMDAINSLR